MEIKNKIVNDDSINQIQGNPGSSFFSGNAKHINTGSVTPEQLLDFAKTLIERLTNMLLLILLLDLIALALSLMYSIILYCSSKIIHRFTNIEREVPLVDAKPGDIVLFSGTDSTTRQVGHMGIITSYENGEYYFIHSTSGKAYGVTISALSKYYSFRFVRLSGYFRKMILRFKPLKGTCVESITH